MEHVPTAKAAHALAVLEAMLTDAAKVIHALEDDGHWRCSFSLAGFGPLTSTGGDFGLGCCSCDCLPESCPEAG